MRGGDSTSVVVLALSESLEAINRRHLTNGHFSRSRSKLISGADEQGFFLPSPALSVAVVSMWH